MPGRTPSHPQTTTEGHEDGSDDQTAQGPSSHSDVCGLLRESGFTVSDPEELLIDFPVAAEAGADPHAAWFAGLKPTVDQLKVIKEFARKYEALLGKIPVSLPGLNCQPPDLLVSGMPGSGRTTSAMACAVYAAVRRGQRVLFICSSAERADRTCLRLKTTLSRLHVGTHFSANRISRVRIAPDTAVSSITRRHCV